MPNLKQTVLESECTGVSCPHETIERHVVLTEKDLDSIIDRAKKEVAEDIRRSGLQIQREGVQVFEIPMSKFAAALKDTQIVVEHPLNDEETREFEKENPTN